ncbi:helix-turn-helix domain-containing protein [Sphingorhabdus sp. EL138]|uniref:helix-turn-helix domain-containing protein n=1 Tax=Sphingorhabdus sp. EL138 TaxID=2073156 RepID=UPI000D689901|nr:AraC family transcriptional regulator [Sphingorhabdus sp. EL138]
MLVYTDQPTGIPTYDRLKLNESLSGEPLFSGQIKKRWQSDDLVIGWMAPKTARFTADWDTITLHSSPFSATGRTGSQKLYSFSRDRGDFSFTPKGFEQSFEVDCEADLFYIAFGSRLKDQYLTQLNPKISFDEHRDYGRSLRKFNELSGLLMDFLVSDGFGGTLRAEALASLLLADTFQQLENKDEQENRHHLSPQKLNLITAFIDEHSDQQITVDMLANLAGISKFHFTRMFKAETSLSPYQYVLRHRIRKAQNLLANSQRSLAEIALDAGFSSQSHLTDAFIRVIGVPPGQFRNDIRE